MFIFVGNKMKEYHRYIVFFIILFFVELAYTQDSSNIGGGYCLLRETAKHKETDKLKSMLLLNEALDIFREDHNQEGLANTFLAISDYYRVESQWDTSLSLALRALKYGDLLNDSLIKAKAYFNLGIIYYELKSYQISEKYSRKAILYGNPKIQAGATANIGMVYTGSNQIDTAFYYFNRANKLFQSLRDTGEDVISNIAIINMNMGAIMQEKGAYDEAKKYFNKSLRNCYSIKDYNSIVLNYLNFGNVFSIEKNYNLAEEMVLRAKSIADSVGLVNLENLSLLALSDIYYAKGSYREAYDFLRIHIDTKDSLKGIDIENKIANLQMKYEVEKQQQQIQILQNERKLSLYKSSLIVMAVLILASIIIFYLNRRRIKIKKKMFDAEFHRKKTQKRLEKAKEDIIYFTKLVQENNERIECFEKELIENIKVDEEELRKKQEKLRSMKILKDEDWIYYKNLFREVDSVFYDKVISIPNLTEGDKRQILLLKMGYTNKISADVLGISTEGIKRARQRLSKKLNLKDASKLEDYFLNL